MAPDVHSGPLGRCCVIVWMLRTIPRSGSPNRYWDHIGTDWSVLGYGSLQCERIGYLYIHLKRRKYNSRDTHFTPRKMPIHSHSHQPASLHKSRLTSHLARRNFLSHTPGSPGYGLTKPLIATVSAMIVYILLFLKRLQNTFWSQQNLLLIFSREYEVVYTSCMCTINHETAYLQTLCDIIAQDGQSLQLWRVEQGDHDSGTYLGDQKWDIPTFFHKKAQGNSTQTTHTRAP